MKDYLELFILVSGVIGTGIGILGTHLFYAGRTRRIVYRESNKAWKMARLVYTQSQKS
jgi:hypothetical protein